MSQQQYDEYGVLIRPRPSQQQVQTVDDYGVPIKKKVGGGTSSTASDIVATPSESPSNPLSRLQEGSSVFPTKENPLPLLETPKTVTTYDGTPLSISPDDKSPYANALRQSPSALSQLQQRVLSKITTPLDLEVLSSGSNKSVAATHAYITKGKDVGTATEINDNTQSTEQFLKNSISGLSKEMGAVNNPDEIANNPDEGASFLSKLHTAIKATQGMSGYLQGVVPLVKSAYDVAENLLSGKVDKNKLATDVQQLSENAGTKVEDKQKAFVAQAQKALPVLVQNITDQTAKEAFDKGIEDSQAIDLLYKRLDPESYEKSVEMRNATPQSASTKVGTSILNGVAAIKNFSDWVTNTEENNKELLNAEKGQYELLLNRGLGNYAAQLKSKGVSTGDQQLIEQANTLIPKIKDESAIVEKYPMLIKQQMADYINQRYAQETGILNGTEVQGKNGQLLKYGGVNTDAAKRYLTEGGFYDKPNFKDYADDVAEHPATYLATGNTVAGAPMQFLNVFKSIFNSVADLEGFRTAEDRHAENIKSQMFPSELTQNIKPDISFDLGGHHFETTVAKTLNGVAHLGGYMATAALGSAIGGAAGLSGSAAARVGAWSSFGADAIDSGLKTADQLNLTPAQSWLYAGMNAVMMAEGGRLLEFGKATPVPQIAGVNQKIADAAIGLTNKTLTEGAAKELVDGAVNTWGNALKKWGIGTAKGAGVMTAFGVGDKMLRVAAGDPNANLNDILPEAANAYFDGVLTMGVIGGFGLPADIAKSKNSTYKAALSSIVDNHDAAKDILQIGLDKGLFSKQEYDQKVAVLNTGLQAKASLNGAIAKTGVKIDGKQRQTWIANATAEKVLRDQAEKEGVSQEEASQYIKQADALKEQNGKIFNGLKFSKLLEPQYNLYDAQQALNEAQKVYAETPTPENEQSVIDKKAAFDKFNENYLNGIPESKTNEAAQAENTVPLATEKTGTTNEAVDNVSPKIELGTIADQVKPFIDEVKQPVYKSLLENGDEADINEVLKTVAEQANGSEAEKKGSISTFGEDIVRIAQEKFPDAQTEIKKGGDLDEFQKGLESEPQAEQQPIVNSNGEQEGKSAGFLSMPNKEGDFSEAAFSNTKVPTTHNYVVHDVGKGLFTVSIDNSNKMAVDNATNAPERLIRPLFVPKDALDQKAKEITVTKPAIFTKENGKFILKEKGEIYYNPDNIPKSEIQPEEPIIEQAVKPQDQNTYIEDKSSKPTNIKENKPTISKEQTEPATKEGVSSNSNEGAGFTPKEVIDEGYKKIKDSIGQKKAQKYFEQVDRLLNPNENNIVEYRENGVVTKAGDKYTFNALSDMDLKNWRLGFKRDISDQFTTNETTTTEVSPTIPTKKATPKEQVNKEAVKPSTQSALPTKEEISKYSAKDKLAFINAVRNKDAKAIQEITDRNRGGNIKLDKADYRLQHKTNGDIESSSSLDNLTKSGNGENLVPDDLYSHPEYYADMQDKAYKESWAAIKKAKSNPDAEVTIYRAVPKGIKEINKGDWVSLSPTYAKQEGLHPTDERKDMPVISKKVKVKDVRWDGNDINEFGYFPEGKSNADKASSEMETDNGAIPVDQYVSRAKSVLEKLFPEAKFEAYDTTANYLEAGGTYGSKGLSRVDSKGNRTIMLDLQEIRDSGSGKTAFHEAIHPIVDEVVGERPEELNPLWNSLAEQMKDVEGFDKVLLHVMNYGAHEHPAAEGITELLTQISEGNISLDAVPPARKGVIIDLLNKLFEKLGLNIRFGDNYDFKSFATDIKKAFETGDTESLKQVVDKKSEENQRAKDNASKISKLLFGSDKADKSETDINDVVKQLRELGLTDKEIEEGLKQSGDSEADIKRALGGGGKSGNGAVESEGDGSGNTITHAAIDDFRREMGFEPFVHVRMTDAEVNAKADKAIADGYDVQKLFSDIVLGHNPNETEVVILKKTKAAIDEAVSKNPSKANLKKAADFANVSDVAGQRAGRTFRLRQDIDDVDVTKQSLGDFFVTRMRNKGITPETMTDAQKSEIQKQYKDLKDAHDKLEAKVAKLVEADAKKKAENAVKKMKDRTSSQPKKTHDEYVKERKSLVEQLKAAKAKAEERMKGITKSGFSVTVTPEMVKIIGKIAYSHVSEGAQKLQDVSQKVFNEIKDVFEGVTQQDVVDVLAGAYNAVKPEKNDILKQMAALRSEAIKESDIAKEKKDAQRLKTIKKTYQGKIDKLKDDLKTGKYLQEKDKPEPLKLDKEALALKDQYISIKQETQRLIAKDEYIKKSSADRFWINSAEALNIMRTIMSSSDFSAVLRQAVVPTIAHPLIAVKSMGGMFRDAFSQKLFDRWLFDLKESPVYDEMVRSKVYVSDPNDVRLSKKEEAFMNNFVEKVPVIGSWLVKGSERAYLSYLNRMRVELYQLGSDVMARNGKTIENSPKDFEGLGSFVNNMTGRGGVPKGMELATPLISAGIFAPRLIASRLNLLGISDIPNIITRAGTAGQKGINVGFYSKLPPEIRRMAITDMAKFVMFGSAVLALTSLIGDDKKNKTVELDPRSSDFGKIRVGDTRYDIWGGMQQYVVLFAREMTSVTQSVKGKEYKLDGKGLFGQTQLSVAMRFGRGKLAPLPSMIVDLADSHRTLVGDKILYGNMNPFGEHKKKEITGGAYFAEHFLPMTSGDIYDALESGDMRNLFAIPATIFGISVQTFNDKK